MGNSEQKQRQEFKYFPFPVTTTTNNDHSKISLTKYQIHSGYNAYEFKGKNPNLFRKKKKLLTMRMYFLVVSEKRHIAVPCVKFGCGNKVQVLNIIFGMNAERMKNAPPYQLHTRLVNTATLAMAKHVHSVRCIISHPCNKLHHVRTGASAPRKKRTQQHAVKDERTKETNRKKNKYLFYLMRSQFVSVYFVHLMLKFPEVSTSMRERKKFLQPNLRHRQIDGITTTTNAQAVKQVKGNVCHFRVKICYVHFFVVH